MRPYLAILKDSVREAVRSRTLPFLLVIFTLVLAVMAPLGLRDETAWRLGPEEVADARLLAAQIRRDVAKEGRQPGDQVLDAMSADLRTAILDPQEGDAGPNADRLRDALNRNVLTSPDFYDETAFEELDTSRSGGGGAGFGDANDPSEIESLLDEGPNSLPADRLGRLNRLLLSAAFPQAIAAPKSEKVYLTYGPWDISENVLGAFAAGGQLELNRSGVRLIARGLMQFVTGNLAGPLGVAIALLVTAALVPQTFEGGAIDLLLSKPVNRTITFLTKFVGGCVFVGLACLYLYGGLWLIAGIRFGVWDAGLIAAAAVLVLQFAVYYSVSAAVGVLWRNPILCVLAAATVWGLSFLVNMMWHSTNELRAPSETAAIVVGGSEVFKADQAARVARWDDQKREWSDALYPPGRPAGGPPPPIYRLAGPRYIDASDTLTAVEIRSLPNEGAALGTDGSRRIYAATAANDWRSSTTGTAPPRTTHLLIRPDGSPLFAGPLGVFGPRAEEEESAGDANGMFGSILRQVGRQVAGDYRTFVAPPDDGQAAPLFAEPFAAAIDQKTGALAIYAGGVLRLYPAEGGEPTVAATLYDADGLPGKPDGPPAVVVAASDGGALVVDGDGRGFTVSADGSVEAAAIVPGSRPRGFSTDPQTGRLALSTHDGPLWVGTADGRGEIMLRDASAAGWGPDGSLYVSSKRNEVVRYSDSSGRLVAEDTLAPAVGFIDLMMRYGFTPLHYVLPDSLGLDDTLGGLFFDPEETQDALRADLDLRQPRTERDFWGPLIHNLAFMAAILSLTCWHVSRTDF